MQKSYFYKSLKHMVMKKKITIIFLLAAFSSFSNSLYAQEYDIGVCSICLSGKTTLFLIL